MAINPEIIQRIKYELAQAPHGHKTTLKMKWALLVQISHQNLSKLISLEQRTRKSKPKRPELREWAMIIAQVKKRPPAEAGELSTDQAVGIAIEAKLIPVSAMDTPISTFDRIMRELGTNKKVPRANRIQADKPNKAHHMDASTSAFFYIARRMPDGESILKIHRPAAGDYKNKPVPVDKLRPYYYGAIDDHSGVKFSRCVAAHGENAADSLLFLAWWWSIMGIGDELHVDQGMLKKCLASADFVSRLGVVMPEYMPYSTRAHGKIERPWRTIWHRFEMPFYAIDEWAKYEITLSEFNRRLYNFCEEENENYHRFEKKITRMEAWRRVMLNGGIVKFPENALATVARRSKRKVDVDGTLEYGGTIYSVKGLHDAWVYVYEGVFEDRLVVQDINTMERFEVKDFKPLNIGEFKNYDDTPHEKAVKEGAALTIPETALPFQVTKEAAAKGKVVSLPIRETQREVKDVFDVQHFTSIEDAMAEFDGLFLPADQRQVIEELIRENGMEKAFVRNLAQEIRGEIEARRAIL